jgi:hypothetical protein
VEMQSHVILTRLEFIAGCLFLNLFHDSQLRTQRLCGGSYPQVTISIRRMFLEDIWGGARRGLLRSSSPSQEGGVVQLALRGHLAQLIHCISRNKSSVSFSHTPCSLATAQ